MKTETKNRTSAIMIEELQDTVIAIESLEEYYFNSIGNVQNMKIDIEDKYEIGLIVDKKLSEYFTSKKQITFKI